jgi:hypothetical protein
MGKLVRAYDQKQKRNRRGVSMIKSPNFELPLTECLHFFIAVSMNSRKTGQELFSKNDFSTFVRRTVIMNVLQNLLIILQSELKCLAGLKSRIYVSLFSE